MMSYLAKLSLALGLLCCSSFAAESGVVKDGRLTRFKAVFIYNFIDYVKWPEAQKTGPFVIAVIGESDIRATLEQIARKRKVGEREIVVRTQPAVGDSLPPCHILFVSSSLENKLKDIKEKIKGKHILTVSDTEGFARKGVAINFVLVDGKLKFEINLKALAHVDLNLSSQLLKLGILVE